MPIAVVTDSTAYLPDECVRRYGVRTVALWVSVDGAEPVPESEFGPAELVSALERRSRVTTSGATAEEFARVYREVLDQGADGVVSVHLSRQLSRTWDAARWAADEVDPDRVRVVDSRSAGMGLGFPVLAAAACAEHATHPSTVEDVAARAAESTTTLFSVPTLEHLRRGGRIGATAAALGTALSIKPVLHVHEGRIAALEKVRTAARALSRLREISAQAAGSGPAAVAVHHLGAPEEAERLATRIRGDVPGCDDCVVSQVGAVIGAHIGPGAVGVVVLPGGWESVR